MSEKAFRDFDNNIKREIRKGFRDERINASGNASNSLRSEITETSYKLYGVNYIKYIDKGRGKGRIPRNFINVLVAWIRNKGLSVSEEEDRRFAGAIAFSTRGRGSAKRRGTRPRTNVIEMSIQSTVPKLLEELASERARQYTSEVLKFLRNAN